MSEKKTIVPKVFPTPSQNDVDKINADKLVQYEAAKIEVANEIYNGAVAPNDTPNGHISAVEIMRQRTANQLAQRENNGQFNGVVVDPSKAENAPIISASQARIDEQMRLRDEQLQKNLAQTNNYQKMEEEARTRHLQPPVTPVNVPPAYVPPTPPIQPPMTNNGFDNYDRNNNSANNYIQEISQAQFNSPFDVIPLPSEGKTYRGKRPNVRVSYMTTADEKILSSPNLLQSGEFLEILINRKLLEQDLRYKDLLPGEISMTETEFKIYKEERLPNYLAWKDSLNNPQNKKNIINQIAEKTREKIIEFIGEDDYWQFRNFYILFR